MDRSRCDSLVIGGGFFGLYLAGHLAKKGASVLVAEEGPDFMQRASYVNQARLHGGYHYPRSVLTAMRCQLSLPRFIEEFPDCVVRDFRKIYAIGRILGKVTARQFELFCRNIGAFCEPAPHPVQRLFDPRYVEAVFSAVEPAFDAVRLRETMARRVAERGVDRRLRTAVRSLKPAEGGGILAVLAGPEGESEVVARRVFNCTYSRINRVLGGSALPPVPLKHEITEMCLVEAPDPLRDLGVTIMCGPFFSVMPFPAERLHSFSHVRYTPHAEWQDGPGGDPADAYALLEGYPRRSAWPHMVHDARRFMPVLADCRYRKSLWEVKTVLPRSETDDSRPILFQSHWGLPNLHCVIGGKIDNVYDMIEAVDRLEDRP